MLKKIISLFLGLFLTVNVTFADEKESSDELWNTLLENHKEFKQLVFPNYEEEFLRLVKEGQSPKVLFIGCSDSRMDPQMIVGARPGDLFVLRTAGNFVPPYNTQIDYDGVAATLQYAVEGLNVTQIIVCGHSHCGAIKALFTGTSLKFLKNWIRFGEKAKTITLELKNEAKSETELYDTAEKVSILLQLENLMTYPFVKERVEKKALYLHGWHYIIEKGNIEYYDPATHCFCPLVK